MLTDDKYWLIIRLARFRQIFIFLLFLKQVNLRHGLSTWKMAPAALVREFVRSLPTYSSLWRPRCFCSSSRARSILSWRIFLAILAFLAASSVLFDWRVSCGLYGSTTAWSRWSSNRHTQHRHTRSPQTPIKRNQQKSSRGRRVGDAMQFYLPLTTTLIPTKQQNT